MQLVEGRGIPQYITPGTTHDVEVVNRIHFNSAFLSYLEIIIKQNYAVTNVSNCTLYLNNRAF